MTVSELILNIDDLLNLQIISRLDLAEQTIPQAMEQDACCRNLLACCNFVSDELYNGFALDCRSTVVEAKKGVADVGGLKLGKALALVDSSGSSVPFRHGSDGLYVNRDGKYNLTYARLPDKLHFTSEIQLPNSKITDRIYTYGVIAEYLRIAGDFNQSESYSAKFVQALSQATSSKTSARLPRRRWLT